MLGSCVKIYQNWNEKARQMRYFCVLTHSSLNCKNPSQQMPFARKKPLLVFASETVAIDNALSRVLWITTIEKLVFVSGLQDNSIDIIPFFTCVVLTRHVI